MIVQHHENGAPRERRFAFLRRRQTENGAVLPMRTFASIPSVRVWGRFPEILTDRERWAYYVAVLLATASIVLLGVRFWQHHVAVLPGNGGQYTEALLGTPKYVNPVLAYTNAVDRDLSQLLFRGLYQINDKGEVEHALADHEEITDDGKTYLITLRQNAVWHDGAPITAQDVAFTFERINDPEAKSPYRSLFKDLTVEILDDYTIKMSLPQPYAPFLSTLTVGIIPQHLWGDIPASSMDLAEYNLKPVGSGPFVFESLTKDRKGTIKSYRLVRFDQYFDAKPYLDAVVFRFYPDEAALQDAIKRGNADGVSVANADTRKALSKENLSAYSLHLPQYTAVFFNQRNPLLKDKVVRQTLERAVDKNAIINEALQGSGEPIYSPILPGFLGYNDTVKGLAFEPDVAKKALDDAGWSLLAGETVRKKGEKELRFALSTVDLPEYVKTAEMLRDSWSAIGVGVELRIYSSNDILKKVIKPRDYEALLYGEIIGTDPDPYPFWHSSQSYDPGLNLAIFYNKQVDQLLEEARQTTDLEQRRLKYLHFQNILADEEPAIFLYNPFYTYLLPKKVKGFTLVRIAAPSDRFYGIERWYIKTKLGWQS